MKNILEVVIPYPKLSLAIVLVEFVALAVSTVPEEYLTSRVTYPTQAVDALAVMISPRGLTTVSNLTVD